MWFKNKIKPQKIKRENTLALKDLGINVIEHLPFLEDPSFRNTEEIAKRMMVLMALFQLHLEAPIDIINKWIKDNQLDSSLTQIERSYLKSEFKDLSEQNKINIYWLIEGIWTFAWIGGLHNKLTFNSSVEDSLGAMLPDIKTNESAKQFIVNFKLRSEFEIFEMLDKFYRVHWFARDNKLNGTFSDKTNLDLVMERRKALEFVCFSELDWDDISLDT